MRPPTGSNGQKRGGMGPETDTTFGWLSEFGDQLQRSVGRLSLPHQQAQIVTLVLLAILTFVLARWLAPRIEAWALSKPGRSRAQLRAFVILRRILRLAIFTLLAWLATGAFAVVYNFPSRRYLLAQAATIATAWLLIRIAAQTVKNRLLQRVVILGTTAYATLYFTGYLGDTARVLDRAAISFGDTTISLLTVLKAVVATGVLFFGARFLAGTIGARIGANQDLSPSIRVLAIKILQVVLYSAALFIGLKAVGFDLTGLAFLSGAVGVGLGFGLQKVVSNLVSGFIILLDKSVKPGDVISIGDTFGWIESLGARYVSVVTRDGKEYLVPNEDMITGQVVNWSHSNEFVRIDLSFGASYDDDPHLVRKIAVEAAMTAGRVLKDRPVVCHITGFGDSSVDYVVRFWIRDPAEGLMSVRGVVYLALWDAFKRHGITIPYPQREVRLLPESSGAADTTAPPPAAQAP